MKKKRGKAPAPKSDQAMFLDAVEAIGKPRPAPRTEGNAPFAGLGDALKARVTPEPEASARKEPAPKRKPAPETDMDAFREAMSDVKEIPEFRALKPHKSGGKRRKHKPSPIDAGPDESAEEALRDLVARRSPIRLADTAEYIEWAAPGASPDLPWQLHHGLCSVQDYIDLHGMTADEARAELLAFLLRSRELGHTCVKVIHGRGLKSPGGPVLKDAMRRWLEGPMSKYVRAYASARAQDGGVGATYVLMR